MTTYRIFKKELPHDPPWLFKLAKFINTCTGHSALVQGNELHIAFGSAMDEERAKKTAEGLATLAPWPAIVLKGSK